jgi:hypothetical protein
MHPLAEIEFTDGLVSEDERFQSRGTGLTQPQREATGVGVPPCEGCAHAPRCRARELACVQFVSYVEFNRFGSGERFPNRSYFRAALRA